MADAMEFHKRALECIEMAQTAGSADRPRLLEMAECWLKLADEALAAEARVLVAEGQAAMGSRPAVLPTKAAPKAAQ